MSQLFRTSNTLTVDPAVAYADGDAVTDFFAISNAISKYGRGCVIETMVLTDLAAQDSILNLVFFSAAPATTITLNAALDLDDADLSLVIGKIAVVAADYVTFADNSVAIKHDLNTRLMVTTEVQDIYCIVESGGTPTYPTASDLVLRLDIRKID